MSSRLACTTRIRCAARRSASAGFGTINVPFFDATVSASMPRLCVAADVIAQENVIAPAVFNDRHRGAGQLGRSPREPGRRTFFARLGGPAKIISVVSRSSGGGDEVVRGKPCRKRFFFAACFFLRGAADCWKSLRGNGFKGYRRFGSKIVWTYRRPINHDHDGPCGLAATGFQWVRGGVQWFDFMTKIN